MTPKRSGLGNSPLKKKSALDMMIPPKEQEAIVAEADVSEKKENKPPKERADQVSVVVDLTKEKTKDVLIVDINEVSPNKEQPRQNFDEDALLELADSIRQFGILQPITVQKKQQYYEIIAGERRWRAAKMAGLKEVPVLVGDYSDQEVLEISLIENIQRESLNPIEEAIAYKTLLDRFSLKQDEVADRVSKSRSAVTNALRLLKLNEKIQQMVIEDMISSGHARALLALDDEQEQLRIAALIFENKLSVREVEAIIKNLKSPKAKKKKPEIEHTFVYQNLEETLKYILGTKVKVQDKGKGKGKIEIDYSSHEELDRIYEMLSSLPTK